MIGVSLGFCFGVDIAVGGLKSWTTESDPVNNEAKFRRDLPSCQKTNEKQKIICGFTFDPSSLMFDVGINDWLDVIDAPDPLLVL